LSKIADNSCDLSTYIAGHYCNFLFAAGQLGSDHLDLHFIAKRMVLAKIEIWYNHWNLDSDLMLHALQIGQLVTLPLPLLIY
jgi:hypothetical protein